MAKTKKQQSEDESPSLQAPALSEVETEQIKQEKKTFSVSKEQALVFFRDIFRTGIEEDGISLDLKEILKIAKDCPEKYLEFLNHANNYKEMRSIFIFCRSEEDFHAHREAIDKAVQARAGTNYASSTQQMEEIRTRIERKMSLKINKVLEYLDKSGVITEEEKKIPVGLGNFYEFLDQIYLK